MMPIQNSSLWSKHQKRGKKKNLLIVTAERIAERQPTVSSITFLLHHVRKGSRGYSS